MTLLQFGNNYNKHKVIYYTFSELVMKIYFMSEYLKFKVTESESSNICSTVEVHISVKQSQQ